MTTTFSDYLASRGLTADPSFAAAKAEALLGLPLATLRETACVTQAQVATLLGKTQAAISKFECRNDFLLSSLFEYAEAIGGTVQIEVSVADKRFSLVENNDEDIRYFSLKERKYTRPCSVLQFATAFEDKKRGTKPMHSAWVEYNSSVTDSSVVDSSLAEQFSKAANDENQSAAA